MTTGIQGAVEQLTRFQVGQEATKGTGVPATARIIGATLRDDSVVKRPERSYAVLDRAVEAPVLVRGRSITEIDTELSFEQVLYPLMSGIAKVTPSGTTGKTWLFTPVGAAFGAWDILTYTFEYAKSDGSANIQTLKSLYNVCRRLAISGGAGEEFSQLTAEFEGQAPTVAVPTTDPGIPARRIVPGNLWTVRFADTFAGLTAASPEAGLITFEWELNTGFNLKQRLDGSTDPKNWRIGQRAASLRLNMDLTVMGETLRTLFQAGTKKFIRLQAKGDLIGGTDYYTVQIDMAGHLLNPPSPGEEEGQATYEFQFESFYDTVGTKPYEVTVINSLAALP